MRVENPILHIGYTLYFTRDLTIRPNYAESEFKWSGQ